MRVVRATVCTLIALALNGVCAAQSARVAVDIKPLPMRAALKELGDQAGLQILYRAEDVSKEGAIAPQVTGELSAAEALDKLLAGTDLKYEFINDRTVRITVAPPAGLRDSADTQSDVSEVLVEVVVTGSNIVSSVEAEKRSIPVDVISAAEIEKTGANTLAEVLASNPAIAGGARAEQARGGRGFVNLRGLGAQYTLVLLSGRRLSANDPANILAIPAEAVERVEILKSGASALYGSDAVAGVVNVILKSSAQSLHASATFGGATQGGAQTTDVNLFGGLETDEARFFFLMNHMTRDEVRAHDRDITASSDKRAYGGFDERRTFGNPARIGGVAGLGDVIADASRVPVGSFSLDPADFRPYNGATDRFDTNAIVNPSMITAPERTTVIGNFEQDLFDARATFFMNGLFWQMKELNYLAPVALSFADPTLGPIPATNPYNPFGQELANVFYIPLELGRQLVETKAHTYRLSSGIRGEIGEWQLESALSWYRSGFVNNNHDAFIRSAVQDSVNRTGSNAFNPFCNQCNTTAQFAGMLTTRSLDVDFRSDIVDFRASGPVFHLPTGAVMAAVGGEFRREGVALAPDTQWQIGGLVGTSPLAPYELERTVKSAFAELKVPLLPTTDARGDSVLELSLAARLEKYSDFGSETSPLTSLRYSLLDGQVTLRAAYAKAFLAPYLEYATSAYQGYYADVFVDPLTNSPVETAVFDTGNPDIDPERSVTRNIGVVVSPHAIAGLTFSLDLYRISQDDLIPGVNPQGVLDGTAPGSIRRGAGVGPGGEDMIIEALYYNLNRRKISGYETTVNYEFGAGSMGLFAVNLGLARLEKFEVEGFGSTQLVNLAGGYDPTAGGFFSTPSLPKSRGALGLTWSRGPWSASSQLNYMSGYRETPNNSIASYATTDFQLSYALGGKEGRSLSWLPVQAAGLTVGVENAFDREVPFLTILNGYNSYENDLRGRFVYARIALDF